MNSDESTNSDYYILETREISKYFGAVAAVDSLSIAIPRRGVTSIVGPNGSGKSTLINLLSGILPLDEGIVIIDGLSLRVVQAHETPDHNITRTFQEVRLFNQISVLDNILVVLTTRKFWPSLFERSNSQRRERAQDILEKVGLWDKRDSLASDLSYGQRKLLEIGRAMALDVNIYLLDEPFAGLFPQMLERVKAILKGMRDEGKSIIFVSHNMDIVREMADHLIVLEDGKFLLGGEVEEVLNQPEVIAAYLGT